MKISELLSEEAILAELGGRIARRRLDLEMTQAELSEQAGVSKRTVERIEAGASAQMSSIIRVFRQLELLQGLDSMIPEAGPRPMDLLKLKGKVRQRTGSRRRSDRSEEAWSWDDDT